MSSRSSPRIADHFASLTDPRRKAVTHPLINIIAIALCATIAGADDLDELQSLRTEMIDRFGSLPVPAVHLFLVHKMRIKSKDIGVTKIDVSACQMSMEFKPDTPVDGMAVIKLVQSNDGYRMNGATGLKRTFKEKSVIERIEMVMELLDYLTKHTVVNA